MNSIIPKSGWITLQVVDLLLFLFS